MEPKEKKEPTEAEALEKYYNERREEIAGQIAALWMKYGQAAKEMDDADRQMAKLSHRVDELDRMHQAASQPTPKE